MAPDLCPYCGKPEHSAGSNFDCPGRTDTKTVVNSAPVFTPPVDLFVGLPAPPAPEFAELGTSLGTKLSMGTLVGEYRIQDRIGEGGMGTVYSAVHPIIGKKVAIKVLAAKLAKNKNAIRRFVLEARAVNDIQHPGLVDIFSFGCLTDGRHYYVMEFLEGRNLGDVLRARVRLPMTEAIPIFLEVGRALVAVHAKGIVHRDLKPENILLVSGPQGDGHKIKLVDFGLAKLVEGVPAHLSSGGPRTAAGVNVGTPHYMSPEQCRGAKIDGRSDLYALGVLLYETLTGKLPIDGPTSLDIWQAHVEVVPVPPIEIAPVAVSLGMSALIMQLLAKQPSQRLQSAADFCAALEKITGERDTRAGAVPSSARTPTHGARLSLNLDELATTTEDLPAVHLPDVAFSEEDRRQEIEDLSTSLGLRIDEPASQSQERMQMSALVINLDSSPGRPAGQATDSNPDQRGQSHSLPLFSAAAKKVPRSLRPIEERNYVPPLAAPSSRLGGPTRPSVEPSGVPPMHRHWGKIIRAAIVVLLLAAATVVAVVFVK
jgi:serine/threonine protein kinase